MLTLKKTNKEYHENGSPSYIETVAIIPPLFLNLYRKVSVTKEGVHWIRVGKCQKIHDNGIIAWTLNYDEKGNVIKENIVAKRKDGTIITY